MVLMAFMDRADGRMVAQTRIYSIIPDSQSRIESPHV